MNGGKTKKKQAEEEQAEEEHRWLEMRKQFFFPMFLLNVGLIDSRMCSHHVQQRGIPCASRTKRCKGREDCQSIEQQLVAP